MKVFDTVAIIGLGLIGSSLTRAISTKKLAGKVLGFDGSEAVRLQARGIEGFGAEITDTLEAAVSSADLVIMAIPVGAVGALAAELCPLMKEGAILSDVGSVKKSIIDAVLPHLPKGCFSCRGIRWRGRNILVQVQDLRPSLKGGGVF